MEKINIAELLKDCPKGMELDCTIYEGAELDCVTNDKNYPIKIIIKDDIDGNIEISLTKEGYYNVYHNPKFVIFPKGKTTWEGFSPPCQFKDGDIVFYDNCVSIFKEWGDETLFKNYVKVDIDGRQPMLCDRTHSNGKGIKREARLATEEEKQKLFQAIKDNGYKWNEETKTLEKFPKFKVGDRIRQKGETSTYTITDVNNAHYFCGKYVICDTCDNDWELVPNKFDITTLKPFESRVLVRSTDDDIWRPAIYGFTDSDRYYVVGGIYWKQCIPYEGNEHLRGTTNDCDEYYKLVNHGRFRIVEN